MLISHSKKFIFIHNYKTAGTSIKTVLTPFADYSNKSRNPLKRIKYLRGIYPSFFSRSLPAHSKASEIKQELGESYEKYFSFAFIRNPWDWQVSLYMYMLKNTSHHQHSFIKQMDGFDQYIRWRCEHEVRLQADFVCDKSGTLLVNYIGRFEHLQKSIDTICRNIGIPLAKLPHKNRSNEGSYKQFYSNETIQLVRKSFELDIELFGYEF